MGYYKIGGCASRVCVNRGEEREWASGECGSLRD